MSEKGTKQAIKQTVNNAVKSYERRKKESQKASGLKNRLDVELEIKRYVLVFFNRHTKNAIMLSDNSLSEIFEYEGRMFTLKDVGFYYKAKPVFIIFMDYHHSVSVELEFNENNAKLVETEYTPTEVKTIIQSQATIGIFGLKRKVRLIDVLSYLLVIVCTALIMWIIAGAVM